MQAAPLPPWIRQAVANTVVVDTAVVDIVEAKVTEAAPDEAQGGWWSTRSTTRQDEPMP